MGASSKERMEWEEAAAVFDLMDREVPTPTVAQAREAIKQVKGRRFSDRSIQPLIAMAQQFFAREVEHHSLLLTEQEVEELRESLRSYTQSPSWIKDRASWFQRWRQRQRTEEHNRQRRLEHLLGQLWMPDPRHVPADLLQGRDGLRAREIDGRAFRWEQRRQEGQFRRLAQIIRCWMDEADEQWLLSQVIDCLGGLQASKLRERYESLQAEACDCLEAIVDQRLVEVGRLEASNPDWPSLAAVSGAELDPPQDIMFLPGWDEVSSLFHRARDLSEDIIIFRDDLLRAVEIES